MKNLISAFKIVLISLCLVGSFNGFTQTDPVRIVYAQPTSGTNDYTIVGSSEINYGTKFGVPVMFMTANTGSCTFNPSGQGARPLYKSLNTNLVAGDIKARQIYYVFFDGSNYQINIGSGSSGGGTWGSITGTLSNQSDLQSNLNALSPLAGSSSITTLGIITSGTVPVPHLDFGTSLQNVRTNVGGTAAEWYTPTSNPMTTIGDIIQATTAGAPARLASVATGNVLISGGVASPNSWGKVDVSAAITGRIPFANVTQLAGLSILGVTGSSTADQAAITGTANQVLRVNNAGTALAFGSYGITNTATLDFGSTAAGAVSDLTITVTGAAVGDAVLVGAPAAGPTVGGYIGWVSATNTVTIRYFNNGLVSAVDPASATFRATVLK